MVLLALAFAFGCSTEPHDSPNGPNDGGNPDREYVDGAGNCRRALAPGLFGCPASYAAALALPSRCGAACAGPVGEQSLILDQCTPSVGCAFDRQTGALVGAAFGDDEPSHCGDHYSVVAGQFPAAPEFNGFDLDESCASSRERNLSPSLDAALRREPLPATGSSCRAGHDDCRGPVTALVCANPRGQVAGDGTCIHCVSDENCRSEYRYADAAVSCNQAGHCVFGSELAGECRGYGEGCFTAETAFVCVDGLCGACTDNAQCSASGPYNLCLAGVCLRSEPLP
ncbi:MAG TPA: hypothetical protein VFK05_03675 [Polyangiaceae bacterium]|nr:hypothetical protein [Polyangiaceae bacterium]